MFLFGAMGFFTQFNCYQQYLNGTGQSKVVFYAVVITLLVHLAMSWLFTGYLKMGVTGVGLATLLTCALYMIFVSLYTWKFSAYPVEPIPTADKGNTLTTLLKVRDVKIYIGISGPIVVMFFAKWSAYQVVTFLTASISNEATTANAIA